MLDPQYFSATVSVIDLIDDPICAHANSKAIALAGHFDAAVRARIVTQSLQGEPYAASNVALEPGEVALGRST
jgi:hypothetical protein